MRGDTGYSADTLEAQGERPYLPADLTADCIAGRGPAGIQVLTSAVGHPIPGKSLPGSNSTTKRGAGLSRPLFFAAERDVAIGR